MPLGRIIPPGIIPSPLIMGHDGAMTRPSSPMPDHALPTMTPEKKITATTNTSPAAIATPAATRKSMLGRSVICRIMA